MAQSITKLSDECDAIITQLHPYYMRLTLRDLEMLWGIYRILTGHDPIDVTLLTAMRTVLKRIHKRVSNPRHD